MVLGPRLLVRRGDCVSPDVVLSIGDFDARDEALAAAAAQDQGRVVASDGHYGLSARLTLESGQTFDASSWSLYLNGQRLPAQCKVVSDGQSLTLQWPTIPRVFGLIAGFAQFALTYADEGNTEKLFGKTEPLLVAWKNPAEEQNVVQMARFVLENAAGILANDTQAAGSGGQGARQELQTVVGAAERLVQVYERNLEYFRTNCRKQLKKQGKIEALAKIKRVGPETLGWIAQHPEELVQTRPGYAGVLYQKQNFLPLRTFMIGQTFDADIYENRVITGFLKTFVNGVEDFVASLKQLEATSAVLLGEQASLSRRLYEAQSRARELFVSYQENIGCTPQVCPGLPRPTDVLTSIPAYRQVYEAMADWINRLSPDRLQRALVLRYLQLSKLYEFYALLRIVGELKTRGFALVDKSIYCWAASGAAAVTNPVENIFIFKRGGQALTLYYEPLIDDAGACAQAGLRLWRSATAAPAMGGEGWRLSSSRAPSALNPDFVLKLEDGQKDRYLIADAKFSSLDIAIRDRLAPLLLRYELAISTLRAQDVKEGLLLLCGKAENKVRLQAPFQNIPNPQTGLMPRRRVWVESMPALFERAAEKILPDSFFG